MPWIVGIDEAGYGPNLGPLVMSAVACRVPERLARRNLWSVLQRAVRRPHEPEDGRLLIEDSKVVYSTARGLLGLETGVLATLSPCRTGQEHTLAQYIDWACPSCHSDLRGEPWYTGTSKLPVVAQADDLRSVAEQFNTACATRKVCWGPVRSVAICPGRFNQIMDRWDSKGAVLGHALGDLLGQSRGLDGPDEPITFLIDKHGGRNTYAAMLQEAIPDGMVVVRAEGMERSVYSVVGLSRELRFVFQPRADGEHFCVALASMFSKYLREVLMLEFNRFWQGWVPELRATAGYPGDAGRFYEQIQEPARKLGIAREALWRRK
jgi:ribonuclease HII